MGLFENMLHSDQSLFKNDLALDFSFIPKIAPYRKYQQEHIASCIKPLLQGRTGKNLLINGIPGIGKTLISKKVFQALEEEEIEEEPILLYINCWQKNTSFKIITDICEQLGVKFIQNKKTEELFSTLKQILNKRSVVLVFDEVDKVEEFSFLYMFLEEIYKKSIIMISNIRGWIDNLDQRIKSRLTPDLLEFKPYNKEETEGILKQRKKYAFVDGVWEEDAFNLVVAKSAELQDIRSGLFLMREAGISAENMSEKKVSAKHVGDAIKKLDEFNIKSSSDLIDDEKKILNLIKNNSGIKSGDLYRMYQGSGGGATYKTIQRRLKKLEEGKFISLEKIDGGGEGKTSIIRFKNVKEKKLSEF